MVSTFAQIRANYIHILYIPMRNYYMIIIRTACVCDAIHLINFSRWYGDDTTTTPPWLSPCTPHSTDIHESCSTTHSRRRIGAGAQTSDGGGGSDSLAITTNLQTMNNRLLYNITQEDAKNTCIYVYI